MQNIVIFGATGSLGQQTLELVQRFSDQEPGFRVVGMSARANAEKLQELCEQFDCERFFLHDAATGEAGQVLDIAELIQDDVDHLIVLDHGLESYPAVLKALAMKKRVSIANKELIIAHGPDLVYLAREQQAELIPLDSEHNAIFQCLQGEDASSIRRVIITASGGPFLGQDHAELSEVTVDQVLDHPNWSMGAKTTVDSATLVNKAFEVIETHQFFGIPYEKIEVRLHPQSIIHAIVEFSDGSSKFLAYQPDMRFSLGYALFYPERSPEVLSKTSEVSLDYDQDLILKKVEDGQYPCFDFVMETAKSQPHSLRKILENDEWAVSEFLRNKIAFGDILTCLQDGLL